MRAFDHFPADTAACLLVSSLIAVPVFGWVPVIATAASIGMAAYVLAKLH